MVVAAEGGFVICHLVGSWIVAIGAYVGRGAVVGFIVGDGEQVLTELILCAVIIGECAEEEVSKFLSDAVRSHVVGDENLIGVEDIVCDGDTGGTDVVGDGDVISTVAFLGVVVVTVRSHGDDNCQNHSHHSGQR